MNAKIWLISGLLIVAVVAVALFVGNYVMRARRVKRLLSEGRGRDGFLKELYKAAFDRRCYILENIYIPLKPGSDSTLCCLPLVLVGRGGIMIFEEKRMSGFIENPMRGDWRLFSGKRITQFQNPVERNTIHARAIKKMLAAEGHASCNVKGLVVLTENDVRLKNKLAQVVSAEASLECIVRTMKKKEITSDEAKKIALSMRRLTSLACRRGRPSLSLH